MTDIRDFLQEMSEEQFREIIKEYGIQIFEILNTVMSILLDIQQKCGDITIEEAKEYVVPAIVGKIIQKKQS